MSQEDFNSDNLSTLVALPVQNYDNNLIQLGDDIRVISNAVIKPLSDGGVYCIIGANNEAVVENLTQIPDNSIVVEDTPTAEVPIIKEELSDILPQENQNVVCNTTAVFACTKCDQEFEKISLYRKHMLWHRQIKKFKCDKCSIGYNAEHNFKLHMALHDEGKPTCPVCKVSFQRLASLKSHLLLHQVEELYTCEECQSEFEREDELLKHLQSHLNITKDNKELICQYCRVTFEDKGLYREHIAHHIKIKKMVLSGKRTRRTNGGREYTHQCGICQKSFCKASLLERHSRVHSGEKPFACEYCDRSFNQKGTLRIHMSKHLGVKPFQCTLCPAEFHQKGNLRVHVQKTHTAPSPGIKIYKCSHCACIFKKIASLNVHVTKAHSGNGGMCKQLGDILKDIDNNKKDDIIDKTVDEQTTTTKKDEQISYIRIAESMSNGKLMRYLVKQKRIGDARWYVCNYCSKEFKKPSDLIRHTRVHTRERPFVCHVCNISFALKSTLYSHLSTHNGKDQYTCPICSKKFSSTRAVIIHLRNHPSNQTQAFFCNQCNRWFNTIERARAHKDRHYRKEQSALADFTQPVASFQIVPTNTNQSAGGTSSSNNGGTTTTTNNNNNSNEPCEVRLLVQTSTGLVPLSNDTDLSSLEIGKEILERQKTFAMKPPLLQTPNGLVPVEYPPNASDSDKQYECQFCHARFLKMRSLKRHLVIHIGEREYKCEYCTKAFFTAQALKDHTLHHTGTKTYGCKECGKKFVTNAILKRHRASHNPVNSFICPYCNKGFKSILLCKKHIWTHRKEALEEHNKQMNQQKQQQQQQQQFQQQLQQQLMEPDNLINIDNDPLLVGRDKIHYKGSEFILSDTGLLQPEINSVPNVLDNSLFQIVPNSTVEIFSNKNDQKNDGQESVQTILINCNDLQFNDNGVNIYQKNVIEGADTLFFNNLDFQDNNVFSIDPLTNELDQILNTNQTSSENSESLMSISELGRKIAETNSSNKSTTEESTLDENLETFYTTTTTTVAATTTNQINLPIEFTTTTQENFQNVEIETPSNVPNDVVPNVDVNEKQEATSTTTVTNNVFNMLDRDITGLGTENVNLHPTTIEQINASESPEKVRGKKRKYVCTHCNKAFANKTTYSKHLDNHNKRSKSQPIMRPCTYCDKVFKKQSDLVRHIRVHTGEKPFVCDKCDRRFTLKSTLFSHQRTHNPVSHKKFNCDLCNSFFTCKSSLKVHMNVHTGIKPHSCTYCPMRFRTAALKKSHELVHQKNKSDDKLNNETTTTTTTTTTAALLASLQTSLPTEQQTVLTQSQNESVTLQVLNQNEQNEVLDTLQEQQNILVVQDSLQLSADTNLISDTTNLNDTIQMDPAILQQLQQSNFFLQEQFMPSSLIQLIQDDGTLLNIKAMNDIDLNNDNKSDKIVNNVNSTSSSNNTVEVVNGKPRNLECDICHKMYASKDVLRRHRKNHGINKKFPCDKCDKGFDTEDQLEKHNKLHSGYRPFTCMYCNNSFAKQQSLSTHIKRMHNTTVATNPTLKEDLFLTF